LTLADKQKNLVKTVGLVIGWAIIVISAIGPLCIAGGALRCYSNPTACHSSWYCPSDKGGMKDCPWMKDGDKGGMMKGPGMMGEGSQDKSK
jgi:hypothetical protein